METDCDRGVSQSNPEWVRSFGGRPTLDGVTSRCDVLTKVLSSSKDLSGPTCSIKKYRGVPDRIIH